ncbi:cobyrinate a,c-diamide synthase [Planotetraspora sp. A-T 1434]|uniref:cobyrinate a,c-diamide synthase n=1 Tax=Planotetraspora sp. A-T 1434 TaxID=2979219 RepID=UPI0021C0770D|nr:cobyrinate a,c-diamide synthase [Planotetraspora sp. A-T 1434]MCT9930804.1 cobyrinate a,c-diamide synthase [Planotetraspora sp. A-T 1434]
MPELPRLVIAAPSSGSGKTTVATGLMAALTAKGFTVSPHKVGPDYIDPGYHALAAGRPGRNLDPWLVGEALIEPLLLHGAAGPHGAAGAGIAVIEGVMGLYDGASGGDLASTAHVARLLDAPVVLVVDASGQGRSVAALVHGFASYDTRVRIGGVILNRVGSPRHEQICRDALAETGVAVLGAIPRAEVAATPSRHLGLVPAAERTAEAVSAVAALGELVTATCDLEALVRLARGASPLNAPSWNPREALAGIPAEEGPDGDGDGEVVVAVAGGKAFTFGYAEQAELIEAAGATVAVFDPLRDETLPTGSSALVLPGGFPEVYAAELSANEPLRREVAAFGGPIVAECAGLLYLCRELDGRPMCGVVDATATMTGTLTLGYRRAVAVRDSVLTREGERYDGHEFHRTRVSPASDVPPLYRWRDGADGYGGPRLAASYVHLHWAGSPHLARRLVSEAGRSRAAAGA